MALQRDTLDRPAASSASAPPQKRSRSNETDELSPQDLAAYALLIPTPAKPSITTMKRFLDVPEVVNVMLGFLSRERIDLLTLSRVCKSLRAQALRIWARHLDLPISRVHDRYQLFQAHPDLLSDVRFLRIRNDTADRGLYGATVRSVGPGSWRTLNALLKMLVERVRPGVGPPSVDVTIQAENRLRLPGVLKERVVALRLLPAQEYYRPGIDAQQVQYEDGRQAVLTFVGPDNNDEEDESELEVEPYGGRPTSDNMMEHLRWEAARSLAMRAREVAALARRGWKEIIDILRHASAKGPGLRTFHFGAFEAPAGKVPDDLLSELWTTLVDGHAHSLRDLSLNLDLTPIPDEILSSTAFGNLEIFFLACPDFQKRDQIEDFLDTLGNLRELSLSMTPPNEESAFSLRQTFPHLRWVMVGEPFTFMLMRHEFAERHPLVTSVPQHRFLPPVRKAPDGSTTLVPFPNLSFSPTHSVEGILSHIRAGRNPSHIHFFSKDHWNAPPLSKAERLIDELEKDHRDAAAKVTCLEIAQSGGDQFASMVHANVFFYALSNKLNPWRGSVFANLVEFALLLGDGDNEDEDEDEDEEWNGNGRPQSTAHVEKELADAIETLVPLHSLRVLRLCDGSRPLRARQILRNKPFPRSLEYVVWLHPPTRVPQYFRFVARGWEDVDVRRKPGYSKYGMLERVPGVVRQCITREGVWERPFMSHRTGTVLDHASGGEPRLVLD
ncbi:hypothetical protein OC834_005727 [Tilletia horrida]|nr:hypothetical protein OC834_005727 [Tilletia horrida]